MGDPSLTLRALQHITRNLALDEDVAAQAALFWVQRGGEGRRFNRRGLGRLCIDATRSLYGELRKSGQRRLRTRELALETLPEPRHHETPESILSALESVEKLTEPLEGSGQIVEMPEPRGYTRTHVCDRVRSGLVRDEAAFAIRWG